MPEDRCKLAIEAIGITVYKTLLMRHSPNLTLFSALFEPRAVAPGFGSAFLGSFPSSFF
jgi:hypothetical protein